MSTVEEIAAAIRELPDAERARLAESLPTLVPELDGDARWDEIIRDPTPRPALTALGDEVEAAYRKNPEQFTELMRRFSITGIRQGGNVASAPGRRD